MIDTENIKIVRKKIKNIYFRCINGQLVVTCNYLVSNKEINKLIKENEQSLIRMINKANNKKNNDAYFRYLGKKYTICFIDDTNTYIDGDIIFVKNEKELEKFYKNECNRIFKERLAVILNYFGRTPDFSLRIRHMKTRWGVNNLKSKTITLNSELLKYSFNEIDYVIVHELCHFRHFNHSKEFWNEVEKYYPNYKIARRELKE